MKVLVADKFEKVGLDGLSGLGAKVVLEPDLKDEALARAVHDLSPQVLVVRGTKVSAEVLDGSDLSVVIRAGAGYNTIDVARATDLGITVSNCPGKNSAAVAELAFGLILSCDRKIPDNVAQLRQGRWNKKEFSKARGICGRTLGLVGMGMIGREMIPRAKAFAMEVLAFSRYLKPEDFAVLGIARAGSLEELASKSDVVSVHVSLSTDTKGMLGETFFSAMKPRSIFVNTSRAEVVDQAALLDAAESKPLWVGLDVFDGEPDTGEAQYDGPLKSTSHVYCTHHIGASTDQAQDAVAREVVRIVDEFMRTGKAPNSVN